ncbi:hypothetical protein D3C79_663630 [compost metagenome]
MCQQAGVEQGVVVVRFPARDSISRGGGAGSDSLLLVVADEVINLVFCVLVAHAAAQGKDRVDVVAGLQEGRQVGGAVAWVAAGVIGVLQVHAARLLRFRQIEELLVGVERLMLGVDAVG